MFTHMAISLQFQEKQERECQVLVFPGASPQEQMVRKKVSS